MRQIFGGGVLAVAGIATFIEAAAHHKPATTVEYSPFTGHSITIAHASGLSQTAYDLVRIGAWALLIFGVLLVVTGLIRYSRRPT
jgi:hypothetical protein